MKNKLLSALIAAAALGVGLAHAATSLRFGYEAPRSDTQHIAAKKFADIVKEKSGGELKISLFPDSTLGNAQAMISGVRGGSIDIEMSGSPNFTGLASNLNIIDIPFIFRDKAHAYRVLDGDIGQGLMKELEDKGRVVLRASGTEPVVRVMVEAKQADWAKKGAEKIAAAIQGQK